LLTINHLVLYTALLLSAVAEFYSIIGLTTIFASAFWPIVILGGSLGLAKVVSVSWLYRNWETAPKTIKYYLIAAITILMFITSMGTFGYLSKAHLDQAIPTGDVQTRVNLYDEKIRIQKDNIDVARRAIKQMDDQVEQLLSRTTEGQGAERAMQARRSQAKEREKLLSDITAAQREITKLNEERAPIAAELRKVVAEVGPIKYIAELIYGDSADSVIDQAVRAVIILIVIVFDPLAVVLLIAATSNLKPSAEQPEKKTKKVKEEVEEETEGVFRLRTPHLLSKHVPLWMKRTHELNKKRKSGKIEIDKKSIKVIQDGGEF